jgi:hypothetical protein
MNFVINLRRRNLPAQLATKIFSRAVLSLIDGGVVFVI